MNFLYKLKFEMQRQVGKLQQITGGADQVVTIERHGDEDGWMTGLVSIQGQLDFLSHLRF